MKLTKLYWLLVLPLVIALAACGGGAEESPSTGGEDQSTGAQPTGGSTISGLVNFTGTAPDLEPIFMDAEPVCQEQYPDGAFT